jgi:hypothetical protein
MQIVLMKYPHYSKWIDAVQVQQSSGVHSSMFIGYIKPILEPLVKDLFESKTMNQVKLR